MIMITQVMTREVQKISCQASIIEAAKKMHDTRVGSLLLEENGVLVGIVTERDFVRKAIAVGMDLAKTSVSNIMTTPFPSIDITKTLLDAQEMMKNNRIRYVVVQEGGRVVGILSMANLLGYFTLSTYSIFKTPLEGSNSMDD